MTKHGLTSRAAWAGVWIRGRSGPTVKGSAIDVERWHRVLRVDDRYGDERLLTSCRPRASGMMFPGGVGRLEVAAADCSAGDLPGDVCPRCLSIRLGDEVERFVDPPVDRLDDLVDAILERMRERAEGLLA